MFFFEGYTFESILVAFAVLAALILLNEIARRNKYFSIVFFIIVPLVFTIAVWPKTAGSGTDAGYWFAWVKTYSVLAGVIGFMAFRYIKRLENNKIIMLFPAFILGINILEAVIRDFECYGMNTIENGLTLIGGPWNIINGIAGILSILTMTGLLGLKIAKTKSKDMIWPDLLWFWIIAYDLWNMSYLYNCVSDRSFYAGFVLLAACTIPAFFIRKGAWLQHRANTLALFAMFSLTFSYGKSELFSITSTHNESAMLILSILAIIANVAVLTFEIYRIVKTRRNPITSDLYTDLKSYKTILAENQL